MRSRFPLAWTFIAFLTLLFLASCQAGTPTPAALTTATLPISPISTTALTSLPVVPPANTDGAETVYVPAGVYLLGSNISDTATLPHEMPEHKVSLSGFNIYTHEVTNAMYQACVDAGACLAVSSLRSDLSDYTTKNEFAQYPVIGTDWFMAKAYCEWSNGRLPTEAEWEAAARGNDARIYPWGNANADCTNSALLGCSKEDIAFQVGSFANGNSPFKGWDMAGNVWEWVNDWYDANAYATSPVENPFGPWDGDFKVIRGGGWNSAASAVRSANRLGIDPALAYKDLGFRCVANGFASVPNIRIPAISHSISEGGGRSVDDGSRGSERTTGDTPHPGDTPRTWTWGEARHDCGSGGVYLFSIQANNNFGGTYATTVDGAPASCTHNSASGWLSCSFPAAPPRTGTPGSEYYLFQIVLTDPTGAPLTDAVYSMGVMGSLYSSCASGGAGIHATAFCGTDELPYLRVAPTTPTLFSEILVGNSSVNYTYSSPSVSCVVDGGGATCPLFNLPSSNLSGSIVSGSTRGTTLDGRTPLTGSFALVSVPTCGLGASGESPRVSAVPSCAVDGSPVFSITTDPYGSLALTGIGDAGGNHLSCVWTDGIGFVCSTPPAGSDGQVRINLRGYRVTHPGEDYPLPQLVFTPASCPGSHPSGGSYTFNNLVCRPDGLPGVTTLVNYDGPAVTVAMQTRYGGTASSCSSSSFSSHSFYCSLPVPLPADLEFCSSVNGAPFACSPSPYTSAHLPARCGGSSETESRTFSAGCLAAGSAGFNFEIGVTGGRNVTSMSAHLGSGSTPCSPNPSMSNTFTCPLSLAYLGSTPTFHAEFVDGSAVDHVVEGFNTLVPASCPGSDTPTTPGGGTCADNTSVDNWHNPTLAQDVNNDGCVTPIDVLSLITRINGVGAGTLTNPRPAGSPFWDVNGDGSITAIDVLMTINYLNTHVGAACTPTCLPRSSGDWSLSVDCAPVGIPAGWVEFIAHAPAGVIPTIEGFGYGISDPGECYVSVSPSAGTITRGCPLGSDLSAPINFWIQHNDGSIYQHTFTNAAELAATCPASGIRPVFSANATCNPDLAGTYNVDLAWTPADYTINEIQNTEGIGIPNCGPCMIGSCSCTGVSAGAGGEIYLNPTHRSGTTNVISPLRIVAPTCSGQNSGWGLSAECETGPIWEGLNVAAVHITTPAALELSAASVAIGTPGLLSCSSSGGSSVITCLFDLYLTPRDPLVVNFESPIEGNPRGAHTFTNFDTVVPRTCVATPNGEDINTLNIRCEGIRAFATVTDSSLTGITAVTFNGVTPPPSDCTGRGTGEVICVVPSAFSGRVITVGVIGLDRTGVERNHPWLDEWIPNCGVTPTPNIITPTPGGQPPSCSVYTNSGPCGNAGCYWWKNKNTCNPKPEACEDQMDSKSCGNFGGCQWDPKTNQCTRIY